MPEFGTENVFLQQPAFGACPTCTGLGIFMKVNPPLVADESKSLAEGCIRQAAGVPQAGVQKEQGTMALMYFKGLADHYGFDINTPFESCRKI